MRGGKIILTLLATLLAAAAFAERINQEGRILGPLPVVTNSILFNTNAADAVLSAMQIFPVTNPWNEDISHRPLLTNSDAMIAQINSDAGATRKRLYLFQEMNYVLVPDSQPLVPIPFANDYLDECDLNGGTSTNGLYPIPSNLPIEGWPSQTGSQTVSQWQTNDDGSDRHSITVEPGSGWIFETWRTLRNGANWYATNGAMFNLNSNTLRPDGWTSGDAAGFPMFPALVRYDECERGMIEHACRLVVVHTRNQHIYPDAQHEWLHRHELSRDGPTLAAQRELPDPGQLDEGRKGVAARPEEIRRDGFGQQQFVLFNLDHARRPLGHRARSSFKCAHRHHES